MASLYLNEAMSGEEIGEQVSITALEARHAVTVGRARVGEVLSIGNGHGLVVTGPVISATPSELSIAVERVENFSAASPRLILTQALAKGDRDELAVQAATELGVDGVIPWAAARSISRWDAAKAVKGQARWASIAREAAKQSIRAWLPEIEGVLSTKQLASRATETRMLVLDPTAELALTEVDLGNSAAHGVSDILVVVGPEGGITTEELAVLSAAGAHRVRLGGLVLRTSTAGPAAIAVLNARLGRW